ncbi:MAG: hypothetical protein PVJ76_07980 [Gemmatimonadota bacterium]
MLARGASWSNLPGVILGCAADSRPGSVSWSESHILLETLETGPTAVASVVVSAVLFWGATRMAKPPLSEGLGTRQAGGGDRG